MYKASLQGQVRTASCSPQVDVACVNVYAGACMYSDHSLSAQHPEHAYLHLCAPCICAMQDAPVVAKLHTVSQLSTEALQGFRQQATVLSSLTHPNLAIVHGESARMLVDSARTYFPRIFSSESLHAQHVQLTAMQMHLLTVIMHVSLTCRCHR